MIGPKDAADLWRAATEADKPWTFKALIESVRHTALIDIASRIPGAVAAEIAQELSLKIPERIARGVVRPGSETAYTLTCARNAAISHIRKHRHQVPLPEEEPPASAPSAEEEISEREDMELLSQALRDASPSDRKLLLDAYFEGITAEQMVEDELARERNPSSSPAYRKTVRARIDNRLRLARDRLRARIEELGGLVRARKKARRP